MTHPHSLVRMRRMAAQAAGLVGLLGALALGGCGGGGTSVSDNSGSSTSWAWALPSFFPTPKVPDTNPITEAKVDLGRFLFYDRRLSGNGTQACASCHIQSKAFTDGLATAIGSTGQHHPRNSQGLANVAYNATLTWANPSLVTLEKQMETPLFGTDPIEMGVNDGNKDAILARLAGDAAYKDKFAKAYPGQGAPITWGNAIHAIASFQRTILSGNSPYDQYLQGKAQLPPAAERGMNLFFGEKAECFHCHSSFNFNDQTVHAGSRMVETPFHNTGLYNIGGTGAFPEPNRGVYELTQLVKDMGKFRAPSLRNVALTGPYLHDGSADTLESVVALHAAGGRVLGPGPYAGDGRSNPFKDPLIDQIRLSAQDQSDLVAFLRTLTDEAALTRADFSAP